MTRETLCDDLRHGEWVRRGMVWTWVKNVPEPVEPVWPHDYDPSKLIACPTCRARMNEVCRRPAQVGRGDHARRLVKRVCSCGGPVPPKVPICGFCRAEQAIAKAAA